MTWPRLSRPPIKEAAFDMRFSPGHSVTIETLRAFSILHSGDYPEVNELFQFQMQARIDKGDQDVKSNRSSNGYRLTSKTRAFVLLLRLDGITISKIEPYISWEELRREARPILEKVRSFFPELKIKRIGLRYINQFDVSFSDEPINSYFNILPSFPIQLPQSVDGFHIRLLIPKKEEELKSIIQLRIDPKANSVKTFRVLFDIDVFKESDYDISDLEMIFSDCGRIREFKNEIFFNGLTDKTLNFFN